MTIADLTPSPIDGLVEVSGRFFRAVGTGLESTALAGSSRPGRYSRGDQPTLYLSASEAGVDAAMIAHRRPDERRRVLSFEVDAAGILDLRSANALEAVRRAAGDPFADWQHALAQGIAPSSWLARDWIERRGAIGLIDPSRKAPGLWHLVLFRWNEPRGATVRAAP